MTSGSFQTCSCGLEHASPLLKAFSRLPISHTSVNIITPYVKRNRKILEEKSWLNPSQRNLSLACWVSLEEQKIHKDQTKHKHSYNGHFKHYYSYWGADTMPGSQCGFTVTVYFSPITAKNSGHDSDTMWHVLYLLPFVLHKFHMWRFTHLSKRWKYLLSHCSRYTQMWLSPFVVSA